MQEYSRILIEEYCVYHPRTKKAKLFSRLVKLSYYMDSEPSDADMVQLEELIEAEKDQNLKTAMEDLNEFFCFLGKRQEEKTRKTKKSQIGWETVRFFVNLAMSKRNVRDTANFEVLGKSIIDLQIKKISSSNNTRTTYFTSCMSKT